MISVISWLPVTVIGAIILFIARETLEYIRRSNIDGRKRKAIRALLGNECEQNYRLINCIWEITREIENVIFQNDLKEGIDLEVKKESGGTYSFRIWTDSALSFSAQMSNAYKTSADRLMMDTAILDRQLFEKLLLAYKAINSLEKIRNDLFDMVESEKEGMGSNIDRFPNYSYEVLRIAKIEIDDLYFVCTKNRIT